MQWLHLYDCSRLILYFYYWERNYKLLLTMRPNTFSGTNKSASPQATMARASTSIQVRRLFVHTNPRKTTISKAGHKYSKFAGSSNWLKKGDMALSVCVLWDLGLAFSAIVVLSSFSDLSTLERKGFVDNKDCSVYLQSVADGERDYAQLHHSSFLAAEQTLFARGVKGQLTTREANEANKNKNKVHSITNLGERGRSVVWITRATQPVFCQSELGCLNLANKFRLYNNFFHFLVNCMLFIVPEFVFVYSVFVYILNY